MNETIYTEKEFNAEIISLLVIMFIILILLFVFYSEFLLPFNRKKNYIKMEMGRSEGEEYLHWKRRLKRHYIVNIPFIGRAIWRHIKKDR